ncbi:hypothetical protein [Arthrobacter sp. efr-133-TYG-120]|uniref:hypothetical protein n=1 Tax=Arthrobacter sp. efr-133-TYG-120 TaxID=3040280 RepID=UPI00254A3B5D|nr:hypothetical protein [Arthrobacter sp. efr-133-TYG-120]
MGRSETLTERVSAYPSMLHYSDRLSAKRKKLDRDGFYVGMLKDDIRNQRYAYEVSLVAQGADMEVASETLFALLNDFNDRGVDRDPTDPFFSFVDRLLEESVDGKGMLLELHLLPEEHNTAQQSRRRFQRAEVDDQQGTSMPSFGYLPRWSVLSSGRGDVLQVATAESAAPVSIPRGRICQAEMRQANRSKWRKTIKELRQVDDVKMFGGADRLGWKGYTFSEQVETQNLAVASTTAPVGWDARGTFGDSVTSPYMAFRRLRFASFWAETVEDTIAFLNQFTSDKSLYGESAFAFSLSGIPSPRDLAAAMQDLRAGLITVEDAHNTYLLPKYAKRVAQTAEPESKGTE